MDRQKKVLLAGSHAATAAMAVVEEIQKRNLPWKIYWVGKKWSGEDKLSESLEYRVLPKIGVTFFSLESGKIQTKFTKHTIPAFIKIPLGFFHTLLLILKIRPDMVLSFGGASGALVSFWAWVLQVPVVIHEQTCVAGRANIASAKFATKIAISRATSRKYFPLGKTILTGNPLRKSVLARAKAPRKGIVDTILFTGGSRGSKWINDSLIDALPELCRKYAIIHLAGVSQKDKFRSFKGMNYKLIGQVDPEVMINLLGRADIVVSRAGANTVSELIALKKPCILIPIPWSYLKEQSENAKYVRKLGLARIVNQSELSSEKISEEIEKLTKNYAAIVAKTNNLTSPDIGASGRLVDLLESL